MKQLIAAFVLLFVIGCSKSREELLTDNSCGEWRLEKMYTGNGSRVILNDRNRLYLVFNENGIYELFCRKKGKKVHLGKSGARAGSPKWSINSSYKMTLSDFEDLQLLQLSEDTLAFESGRLAYFFTHRCR